MERILKTQFGPLASICLVLLLPAISRGQSNLRESSDPYFQSQSNSQKSSTTQTGSTTRSPATNNFQPRNQFQPGNQNLKPKTSSPAQGSVSRLQPKTYSTDGFESRRYPLQPKSNSPAQLATSSSFVSPSSAAQSQIPTPRNNDFRPPGVRQAANTPMDRGTRLGNGTGLGGTGGGFESRLNERSTTIERSTVNERSTLANPNPLFKQSPEFQSPEPKQRSGFQPTTPQQPANRNRDYAGRTRTEATRTASARGFETGNPSMRTSTTRTQVGEEFEPGRVVAIVGGRPIFVGDMLFEVNQLLDRFMPGAPPEAKKRERANVIKKLVPKFIDSRMLLIDTLNELPPEADFEAIVESAESDFDDKALPILMEKSGVNSALAYDAHLRSLGGSLRQLRRAWAEEQLIKYFVGRKLQIDMDVSHQDMLDYYHEHQDEYYQKPKVLWEELAIRYDKTPDREEARKLITAMGNEVVYGAPLEAVAKRSSQGFTAEQGGNHDWTHKGSLVYKDVEKQLFSIPLNQLSDVIASRDGLHIVRVLDRKEESYTPFLEAQVKIREMMENKKRSQAFEDHLTELRKKIPFEVQLNGVELPAHLAQQNSANFK